MGSRDVQAVAGQLAEPTISHRNDPMNKRAHCQALTRLVIAPVSLPVKAAAKLQILGMRRTIQAGIAQVLAYVAVACCLGGNMLKTALLALAAAGLTIPALAAETDVLDQPVDPFEQVVREIENTVICNWINLQIEKRRTKIAAVTYPTPEEQLFLLVSLAQQQEECGIDNTAEINGLNGGVHEVWLSSSDG